MAIQEEDEIIPVSSISGMAMAKFTKRLVIKTHDGKTHNFSIGGLGGSEQVLDAIFDVMP